MTDTGLIRLTVLSATPTASNTVYEDDGTVTNEKFETVVLRVAFIEGDQAYEDQLTGSGNGEVTLRAPADRFQVGGVYDYPVPTVS